MKGVGSKSSTLYEGSKFYKANIPRARDVQPVRVATSKHDKLDQGDYYKNLYPNMSKEDEEWLARQ